MATFKSKMKHLEDDWQVKIWEKAQARNEGKGANWLLPLAALAITGVRPASLEKGIVFTVQKDKDGARFLVADFQGAKILKNPDGSAKRGQDNVSLSFRLTPPMDKSHCPEEFWLIAESVAVAPGLKMEVQYDAEAISTRLREISKEIWPRKTYHVSAVCYRELFASKNKEAGVDAAELAMAMGHISAESQGKYASRPKKASDVVAPKKTFGTVTGTTKVKKERAPMARFKAASSLKTAMKKKKK
jgi:hypothetical protein